jgi:SAM-dependent methyltransferase
MSGSTPRCLVCGSALSTHWAQATDVEYFTTTELFDYLRCDSCACIFIDPVPRDRLSEIYPSNYYSFAAPPEGVVQRFKKKLDQRLFRRLLGQLGGNSLSLLDVGGGAGWELSWIRTLDPRVQFTQVIDLDPQAEAAARANGHVYFCGRAEEFTSDRRFDLIMMLNLIEHVDDPRALLSRMRALLSSGGRILIKTPNLESLDARLFRHRNWGGFHCPRHWVLFSRDNLMALGKEVGLRVVDFRYTQGAPFWAVSVLYWLYRRGLVSLGKSRPASSHPLYNPLAAFFAVFDFLRMPLSRPSQMFLIFANQTDTAH